MVEWFNLPPILGMLPLLLFIVLALMGKPQVVLLFLATALAMLLSGTGLGAYSDLLKESLGSDLAMIGIVIMFSTALGKVLEQTGVSQNIVSGIVRRVGVKTEKRAILVTMFCTLLVCGVLGTLGGGTSIIAPIIIPVVASVGLSKSTVSVIFQNAGETGLTLGPLSPTVVMLLTLTGLSYGRMMIFAAIPFALVWLITLYFCAKRVQKKTKDTNPYTDVTYDDTFVPTKKHKQLTALFVICFVAFIAYAMIGRLGIGYLALVMLLLTIIMGVASAQKPDDLFKNMIGGMAQALPLFFMFLLFGPLFNMMEHMGAFAALADFFGSLIRVGGNETLSRALVMILGSVVGGFGIEGAAVVQMQITHSLFEPFLAMVNMPMEMWAVALIAASRVTNLIYPNANMVGQMGIARSDDIKTMLKVGWTVAAATMGFIFIYAFLGAFFLF